jgi:polysaccharide export outer membrane protein
MHLLGWNLNLTDWIGRFLFSIACVATLVFGAGFAHAQSAPASPSNSFSLPFDTNWVPARPDSTDATGKQPKKLDLPLDPRWVPVSPTPVSPPASAVSERDSLSVGVGDQIFITVFGQPDMSAEVTVNDNQQVTLPLVGMLKVGGLSPAAIEKLVAMRLKDGDYLRNPEVSVQVRQVRSQMISVLGEVQRPGRFALLGKLSVLDALATAGGLTARADRTVFLIRRKPTADGSKEIERQEIAIQLDQLIDVVKGDVDLDLKNLDVIYVGQQKLFYVHGEVRKPGAYPMEPELTVMRVLAISGGVTDRGSMRRIRIHRKGASNQIEEFTPTLNTKISGGDVVFVDERLF